MPGTKEQSRHDEERVANLLVFVCATLAGLAFLVAVVAMLVMH